MGGIIAESQRRVGPRSCRTAFERNLLPGFAEWLREQIKRVEPDFLVPAETKGVHVLDAALAYARDELGTLNAPPVLYTSALAFLPSEVLRESRVMAIDNAVNTGATMAQHRTTIETHGVTDIEAVACMACGERNPRHPDVDCYLRVNPERYTQYLWQLTELVVARGLPPEVDHFVFDLRLPIRLRPAWRELQALLADYGALTVDGPASKGEEMQPMTLHFPQLPGVPEGLANGVVPGPNKLRFLPDPGGDKVFVVPISFPSVTLPPGRAQQGRPLSQADARAILRDALGAESEIGELLIERARELNPLTVFRAISTARELELIAGIARLLGAAIPGSALTTYQDIFDRLYGPEVGLAATVCVRSRIDSALTEAEAIELHTDQLLELPEPKYLDSSVARVTRDLAERLSDLYLPAEPDQPAKHRGLSMPEVIEQFSGRDPLLASRCVTFGLAMTTLVPYIESIDAADGSIAVERRYRVSERAEQQAYRDLDIVRCEKSEQALALICRTLCECCPSFGTGVPRRLLTHVVSILRSLILAEQSIELKTLADTHEPRLVLLDSIEPIDIHAERSEYFTIYDDPSDEQEHVRPTDHFEEEYDRERLDLDVEGCTEGIETHVEQLAQFINTLDDGELDALLKGWSMSTDERLGLTHVRRSLDVGLAGLRSPLKRILRGDHEDGASCGESAGAEPCARPGQDERSDEREGGIYEQATGATDSATAKLDVLLADWSAPARQRWSKRSQRREQRLLVSLARPDRPVELYAFASSLTQLVKLVAKLVDLLDGAYSDSLEAGNPEVARDAAATALAWCARIRRSLTSLSDEPRTPQDGEATLQNAARELLDMTELLGAFAASLTGVFRGVRGGREPSGAQHRTVLSLDLADSSHHSVSSARSHTTWVEDGLDLAAQWTRAFGGWELPVRNGDEITIESEAGGDAIALAAAAVLCHTRALRSTGIDTISWRFHSGVDCGEVEPQNNNLIGRCLNGAAKLAKHGDGKGEAKLVMLTKDAAEQCSEELLREPIATWGEPLTLAEIESSDVLMSTVPCRVDSHEAIARLARGMRETAESALLKLPSPGTADRQFDVQPVVEEEVDASEDA
ncbi:MAG TPA: hypothetical protein VMF09_04970 [Solirubrobacteraceae bacterium]|nr:hypothetical protein [Solirubrobacteraceae bacterium]